MGITVSHVLIKWMVHSIEWRNEAKCHPGLITKMPPFPPLTFGLQYFKMKENRGSSLTLLTAQVTSAQFGQTVLLLKFKISLRSRRKRVLSVAACFQTLFRAVLSQSAQLL